MKTNYKLILTSLISGLLFSILMSVFDYSEEQEFNWTKFIYVSIIYSIGVFLFELFVWRRLKKNLTKD